MLVLACTLAVQAGSAKAAQGDSAIYHSVTDLKGKTIAYVNGSVYNLAIAERTEDTTERWFASFADCVAAVESGKVDAACQLTPICELAAMRSNGAVSVLGERVRDVDEAFFFPHGDSLIARFNEVIAKLDADGTLAALKKKWVNTDEGQKVLPDQDWDAPNGTLKFVTSGVIEPLSYAGAEGTPTGYDVELALIIAKELGYHLDITLSPMDSIFAEVSSGKANFGGTLTVTPERAEMVDFTDRVIDIGVSLVVPADKVGLGQAPEEKQPDFFSSLAASFERTFVTEERWKMILAGLGVTLLISIASGVLGCALGFATVLLRRRGNRAATLLVTAFQGLMGGLPVVVVLMVFYYVFFGSIDLSATVVAILVFTLIFGASTGAIMWNALKSVDMGQTEAGLALGYSERETFFKVQLPQAARQFAPLLLGQFVSLVKDTAVVGYISVQDLTRAGDLIRARTMEAFFPLFAVAAIYFVACRLLAFGAGRLTRRLEPQNRPRLVKGVTP